MDNFWLPEGMIILSIVGSESELFDGSRGGAHDADECIDSGRIGQSVINNEESLPSQGPKWQKHNHTAAVKVSCIFGNMSKSGTDMLSPSIRPWLGVHGKIACLRRVEGRAIRQSISGEYEDPGCH